MRPPGFDRWRDVGEYALLMMLITSIALAILATTAGVAVGILWAFGFLPGGSPL